MIEKVRLAAMAVACSCWLCRKSRRPSRGRAAMQPGSRGLLPAAAVVLLPIATVDTVLRRKRFPRQPRLADTFLVAQVEGAIERQCLLAPRSEEHTSELQSLMRTSA